jgi:hypothetical protein
MMDRKVIDRLVALGKEIKALLPDWNCNVQFNLSKNHPEPKVNVNLSDVTEMKK